MARGSIGERSTCSGGLPGAGSGALANDFDANDPTAAAAPGNGRLGKGAI